jgi:hypothetical protein
MMKGPTDLGSKFGCFEDLMRFDKMVFTKTHCQKNCQKLEIKDAVQHVTETA